MYCGQTVVWIKMPLRMEVGLVLDGDPAPPPRKKWHSSHASIFGPCLLWPNGWMDQDATWCGGRPRLRRHCVRWGPTSSATERGTAVPHFSVHIYCGHTAGLIRIPLGMEAGLSPGDIVLDGDPPTPTRKGAQQPPLFGPCLLCPNGRPSQQLINNGTICYIPAHLFRE